MDNVEVIFPEDEYIVVTFLRNDKPGEAEVNISLKQFKHKRLFDWHLSIILETEDADENGMPTKEENEILVQLEDVLHSMAVGDDDEQLNALFVAGIDWNESRELIWRIHNPEVVDKEIQKVIEAGDFPRKFDYKMVQDPIWSKVEWYLNQ